MSIHIHTYTGTYTLVLDLQLMKIFAPQCSVSFPLAWCFWGFIGETAQRLSKNLIVPGTIFHFLSQPVTKFCSMIKIHAAGSSDRRTPIKCVVPFETLQVTPLASNACWGHASGHYIRSIDWLLIMNIANPISLTADWPTVVELMKARTFPEFPRDHYNWWSRFVCSIGLVMPHKNRCCAPTVPPMAASKYPDRPPQRTSLQSVHQGW